VQVEGWRRSVVTDRVRNKNYYMESWRTTISYIKQNEIRLNRLVTYCKETKLKTRYENERQRDG